MMGVDLKGLTHFPAVFRGGAHERRQDAVRSTDGFSAEEQRLRALLDEHIAKCLQDQQPRPSPLKLELVEGSAADVIRNAVERLRPDLLALGTNSRSGLAEAFVGSTTREFLVNAPCDILVARA
jgi:nucleotide-binding universal stress UspA family protein